MTETIPELFRKSRVYWRRYLKFDLIASLVVFLVAIPLCLGIALASGAPLFSGVLSGIIGGIVVGALSGSAVSVSGPAAGMAAVAIAAIAKLGGFEAFLVALALAGFLQILVGSLKAGFVVEYVPSNVVQGLLCAIGILLIIKQLPLAFTLSQDFKELQAHLLETTTEGWDLNPLYRLYSHINHGAAFISLVSFAILIYFEKTKIAILKEIPASIIVVIMGIFLNEFFTMTGSHFAQSNSHLVNIPAHNGFADFLSTLNFPDWRVLTNPHVYLYALILAIVASLESLLNVKAGEKLDKERRQCPKDRELIAQGTGNLLAGLLGGLPVTSVIVRTSVNIQAGAKTKMSAILHGVLLLFAVFLMPEWLNKIPLSSLAAILIFTGYKLTKPAIYQTIFEQGSDRFVPFIVTVIGIVFFNLLAGVLIGLSISFFTILKKNSQVRLDLINEIYPNGMAKRLVLPQQVSFLNKASLILELQSIPENSQLIIDARHAVFIDKEILELIHDFWKEEAPHRKISLNLVGFQEHYDIHNFIDFINVTTYDVQATLTPREVLTLLKEGNLRFLKDQRIHRSTRLDIKYTAERQFPMAVVLGCIDSRVPVETIFDTGFGDLFCVRIAGNVVNDDILASIEYACDVVGAKLIVVLGHTRCGAIQAACDGVELGHLGGLLDKIKPAVKASADAALPHNGQNMDFTTSVTSLNIANTLESLYRRSDILKRLVDTETIAMTGALYKVESGNVQFGDYTKEMLKLGFDSDSMLIQSMQAFSREPEIVAPK